MKFTIAAYFGLLLALAESRGADSTNYSLTPATFDVGGQHMASASYSVDASLGGIGSQDVATGSPYMVREGYAGQLFEVATLMVATVNSNLDENASVVLNPYATLTDGTKLSPALLVWSCSGGIASVSPAGLVTAANVWANTSGTVWGSFGSKRVTQNFWVLDSDPDDFGLYASDGIPDWWQAQYFGTNNPSGMALADADGTGQNNYFKYIAGLNPTNPASIFELSLSNALPAGLKVLTFSPRYTNRTYTVQYVNALGTAFSNLLQVTVADNGTTRAVTDTNANTTSRFYRVRISYP